MQKKMTYFEDMEIKTSRLTIKPILAKEAAEIHELLSLPETDAYNALGIPKNLTATKAHIKGWINDHKAERITNYTLAIREKEDNQFIGLFGIKLGPKKYQKGEIWYKLHKDYWSQGYATEASKSVIDFCFLKLDLHRIEAGAAIGNVASHKVLAKTGMKQEGIKRQLLPLKTGWSDTVEYGLLRDEYYLWGG